MLSQTRNRNGPAGCDHLVQVYREPSELGDSVAAYLATGLDAGQPALAVATGAHWEAIADGLRRRGREPAELEEAGRLLVADAETTLAAILEDGVPSPHRFAEVVGGLVEQAAAGSSPSRLRIFGEMVDLLCRREAYEAADALEQLWNRTCAAQGLTLLCAYRIDLFDRAAQVSVLPTVYRAHSQVLPSPDAARMEAAVAAGLAETLGRADAESVYARAARHTGAQHVPRAEAALVWLSAHMPRTAQRALAAARRHYVASEAA